MKKYELNESEITFEAVRNILNDMFYEIRQLSYKVDNEETYDRLCSCLDGSVDDVPGVMLLMGYLKGETFSLVTDQKTGERRYVKDEPQDPKKIYVLANKLVDVVNGIVEKQKVVTNKR